MIDYDQLTGDKPNISYDTSKLEKDGYKVHFALNPQNPIFQQVIDECEERKLPYKILDADSSQKHIWIKGWKKV